MRIVSLFLLVLVLALTFFCGASLTVFADGAELIVSQYEDYAESIYFYSYDAKSVLYFTGEDKILKPASTVKIMTGLLACEKLESRLDEKVLITKEMLEGHTGTTMELTIGSTVSVRDLLYGTICGCNNDAAQALALVCSGSIEAFVVEMNEFALQLGMQETFYTNPTGIDESLAQTTIDDVALLSHQAAKNSLYTEISSAKSYSTIINGEEKTVYNRNALISHFTSDKYLNENVFGLIAGSTDEGGYVVSALAEVNDSKYLCIILGAKEFNGKIYSYEIANELINGANQSFEKIRLFSRGEDFSKLNVNYALNTSEEIMVSCVLQEDVYAFLPKNIDLNKELKYTVFLHESELDAPIEKGVVLGGINVYYNDKVVASGRLVCDETIEANSFLAFMGATRDFLLSRYFLIFLFIFFVAILIFIYFDRRYRQRKKVGYIKYKNFF